MSIDSFLRKLYKVESTEMMFNQYHNTSENYKVTRNNIKSYLEHMAFENPKVLIVGEAPGYKGCRLTGVPFTAEKLLVEKRYDIPVLKLDYHFRKAEKYSGEASATIVWETFNNLDFCPLIWNAFPYHPYKKGDEQSNRKPSATELAIGKKFLEEIIKLFGIESIYAIGNTAYDTLSKMGFEVDKIRHPANGGKRDFVKGIEKIKK